jgi:hypothetical protein
MTSKQLKVGFILFAFILAVAFLGGSWESSLAQTPGTVPLRAPLTPAIVPLIPVTGCPGPFIETVGGLCVPVGVVENDLTVKAEVNLNAVGLDNFTTYSDVMLSFVEQKNADGTIKKIMDYEFLENEPGASIYFDLSESSLKAFKQNSSISIFWFNPETSAWEKIPSTLGSGTGQLVAPISVCGLYVVAAPLE